jgi:uncharacterized membrane protein YbhN (UPF0104 family)
VTVSLAGFLVWRLRDNLGTVQLRLARPEYLLLALLTGLSGVLLSVWLWRLMLRPDARLPFRVLLAHYLSGLFWNHFLPGGVGGDVVRVGALWESSRRPQEAFNSVLMARFVGLWSIVLLASAAAVVYTLSTGLQAALPFLILSGGALVAGGAGTAFVFGAPLAWLLKRLPDGWGAWHAELRAYRSRPVHLMRGLGLSLAIQVCAVGINILVAQALDLAVPHAGLVLAIPLVTLSGVLPISLGGFGVREGAYLYLLGQLGGRPTDAVLLSLAVYTLLALVAALGAALTRPWASWSGGERVCES